MVELVRTKSVFDFSFKDKAIVFISAEADNLPQVGSLENTGWDVKALRWEMSNDMFYAYTGVKYYTPAGCDLQLRMRSSTFLKTGLMLTNSVGTLDPMYRGEIIASCWRALNFGFEKATGYLFQLVISNYIKPGIKPLNLDYIFLVDNKYEYDNWDSIVKSDRGTDGGLVREANRKFKS